MKFRERDCRLEHARAHSTGSTGSGITTRLHIRALSSAMFTLWVHSTPMYILEDGLAYLCHHDTAVVWSTPHGLTSHVRDGITINLAFA